MKRVALFVSLGLVPLGCGGDKADTALTGTDGSGGEQSGDDSKGSGDASDGTGSDDSVGGTDGGTTGDDSSSDSSNDPDPEDIPPPPATGIQIVHVTADQGVRVPVALDGALVPGTSRNLPLLQGRALVLRAFYELDAGYEPRDIYALLTLHFPDGTSTTYENFVQVIDKDCSGQNELDCRYGTLPNTFFWRIPPSEVVPGLEYSIELFETAPGHEEDVSDKVPVFPTDGGSMQIGVEDTYMKMKVVLVPVDHDIGAECPEPPDLNEDFGVSVDGEDMTVADFFGQRLLAQNPIDTAEIMVHDTVRYTGSLTGSQLLGALQQLRSQEGAPPEYFYYAVARPCDEGPDFAGVAQIGGPSVGNASQRVGWGVYYQSKGTTAETFVHEIGHQQGRYHIHCSGEEAGTDPSYPDPDGNLISWGIDAYNNQLKVNKPSDHDYMTYCSSTWVSEWGYSKVLPWIDTMSSWDLGDVAPAKQPLLVGNLRADGTEEWYVTEGYLPTDRMAPQTRVRYDGPELGRTELVAAAIPWERSDDLNIIAPLPASLAELDAITFVNDGREHVVDTARVSVVGPLSLAAPQ
jgi:hypothetical protein